MVTHRYYQPELRDDGYTRYAILHPTDEGVLHKEYAASWDAMSAYERCLVHWMEINAYGLEARAASESEVDWFQVRMEDLIDPQTGRLAELIDFLRLPQRSEIIEATRIRFDQFRTTTHIAIGWEQIRKHSAVTDLAASLGYDAEVASAKEIMDRYWRAPRSRRRVSDVTDSKLLSLFRAPSRTGGDTAPPVPSCRIGYPNPCGMLARAAFSTWRRRR